MGSADAKTRVLRQLGENIRAQRARKGLSQESLAHMAGLDRSFIGDIERGESDVSVFRLCRIAHVLKVTPTYLLEGVEYQPGGLQDE